MQGIQGTGSVDSWAQFVNLVQDARSRNQALAAAKSAPLAAGPARIARRIVNQPAAAPRRADKAPDASPVTGRTSVSTTNVATKALEVFLTHTLE